MARLSRNRTQPTFGTPTSAQRRLSRRTRPPSPPRAPARWSAWTGAWPWPPRWPPANCAGSTPTPSMRRSAAPSAGCAGPSGAATAAGGRAGARKDWVEKLSTDLARRFDLIRVEDLRVRNMTRSAKGTVDAPGTNVRPKAGLNRAILDQGWGVLVTRLEQKAPGRVEKVNAAYTSQRCHACGYTAAESRESQARFGCRSCGHTAHADLNAARNIAAGHAGTAPGGPAVAGPVNREPQHASLRVA